MPADPLQDSVDVGDTLELTETLVGFREQVRPPGVTDWLRLTVPANPLTLLTVTVEVPVTPWGLVTDVGFSDMPKSCTMNVTVVLWDCGRLFPMTITLYVPALPLQVRVEVAEVTVLLRVTEVGVRLQLRAVEDDWAERLMVPEKPLTALTVIVDDPMTPALTVTVAGLAVSVKSVTVRAKLPELPE